MSLNPDMLEKAVYGGARSRTTSQMRRRLLAGIEWTAVEASPGSRAAPSAGRRALPIGSRPATRIEGRWRSREASVADERTNRAKSLVCEPRAKRDQLPFCRH